MTPKLEQMDWENVKKTATEMHRQAQLQLINAEFMLERADDEIRRMAKTSAGNKG